MRSGRSESFIALSLHAHQQLAHLAIAKRHRMRSANSNGHPCRDVLLRLLLLRDDSNSLLGEQFTDGGCAPCIVRLT
jgi:hypothetical protein